MSQLRTLVAPGILRGIGLDDIGASVFNLRETMPSRLNAGVPAGTLLMPYDASGTLRTVTITTPTTFYRKHFGNCMVICQAPCEFLQCAWDITDSGTAANRAIINVDSASAAGTVIEQCDLINRDQKGFNINAAIRGQRFRAYRNKIMGTMDGIRPNLGPGWEILGNFIAFLGWWAARANGIVQPNDVQTHSDCIQTTYGGGTIIGNALLAYPSTVVGTGTPGAGTDTGYAGAPYTQAESNARRAELMGSSWSEAAKSFEGVAHENGGVITPLMLNVASGPTAMGLTVEDNWFGGGAVHVNGSATNLTGNLGSLKRNKHYDDTKNKVLGRAFGYRILSSLTADIPSGTDPDRNTYVNGGTVVRINV